LPIRAPTLRRRANAARPSRRRGRQIQGISNLLGQPHSPQYGMPTSPSASEMLRPTGR
jgi:hypothetical protein